MSERNRGARRASIPLHVQDNDGINYSRPSLSKWTWTSRLECFTHAQNRNRYMGFRQASCRGEVWFPMLLSPELKLSHIKYTCSWSGGYAQALRCSCTWFHACRLTMFLLSSLLPVTAVKKVVEDLDVPMWVATGENIDLSEGQVKPPDTAAAAEAEVRFLAPISIQRPEISMHIFPGATAVKHVMLLHIPMLDAGRPRARKDGRESACPAVTITTGSALQTSQDGCNCKRYDDESASYYNHERSDCQVMSI